MNISTQNDSFIYVVSRQSAFLTIALSTLFFTFFTFQARSQESYIDSLSAKANQQYVDANYGDLFVTHNLIKNYYIERKDTSKIVYTTINMADACRAGLDYLNGLEVLNKLESSNYFIKPHHEIGICLVRGSIYYELNQPDSSLYWGKKGVSLSFKNEKSSYLPLLYNLIGGSYSDINADSSLKYIELSAQLFLARGDTNGVVLPYINASRILADQKRYQEAEIKLMAALDYLDKFDVKTYRKMAYEQLGIIHTEQENFKTALSYLKLRDSVNFEINNHRTTYKIAKLQNDIKNQEANQDKNNLQAQIEVATLKNKNTNLILFLAGITILALVLLLYIANRSSRARKTNNGILKDLNLKLQTRTNELAELHTQLKFRNNKLEELNQFKNEILSIIGHDTRAPLAQVITFLQAKAAGIPLSEEELQKMDNAILANAQNGLLVLDNLLKWANSQIDSVKLNPELMDSDALITDVINQVSPLSKAKGLQITTVLKNIQIEIDLDLYQIVLRNLLSNAIKFSPANAEILIQTSSDEDSFSVQITDQGPGLPESIIELIKEGKTAIKPKAGSSGERGAGLGLKLSMDFSKRIGGEILFSYVDDHGTRATFTIPKHHKN